MSTLITGVSGFIGFNLCRKLLAKGKSVIGLDSLIGTDQSPFQEDIAKNRIELLTQSANANHINIIEADLRQAEPIREILTTHRPTTVIHLPDFDHSSQQSQQVIAATINLLDACQQAKIEHFIISSSHAVYFPHQHSRMSVHELTEHPRNLKAATARSCELLTHGFSHEHQLPCTLVRLFNLYGPDADAQNIVRQLWQKVESGESIQVEDYLNHEFDFTYIEDVCNTFVRLMAHPAKANPDWELDEEFLDSSDAPWRIYNSGTGVGTDILSLISMLEEVTGKKAVLASYEQTRSQALFKQISDNTELLRDTGYQPRTRLLDGLKSMRNKQ